MEKLLKGVSFLIIALFLVGSLACSGSSTNNDNQTTSTETSTNTTNAGPAVKSQCNRPLDVSIAAANLQSKGLYNLTYHWNGVDNATSYEFNLLINGNTAFQNLAVTDTFITFSQAMVFSDSLKALVRTVCGPSKSNSAKESSEMTYMNAITVDDIVFIVEPTTSVTDICSKNCEKLKFNSNTLLNSDGSILTLNNFAMQVHYYDFNAIKDCIECTPGGGAPVVNESEFNNCLNSPLNQYWLYDPNQYTICL